MRYLMLTAIIAVAFMKSCTPVERDAYQAIVSSRAFLRSVSQQHPECASASSPVCTYLSQAVSAKDLLIDATEAYCAGPDFDNGGSCNPPAKGTPKAIQLQAKLSAAVRGYNQAAADLKGAIGK